jgi:RHS repeat-associated protein
LTGNLTNEFDGASGSIAYGRSPAGEVTSITNKTYTQPYNTPNLVSNIVNGPFGPITYDMGNGVSALRTYDSSGRLNGGWLCPTSGNSNCYNAQIYGFAAGQKGQQVQGACDTVVGGGCRGYGYDEFNRLTSLSGPPSFSYVYDRYGNRWQQNAPQGGLQTSYSFNSATNQNTSLSYDAAGNVTYDGFHSYTYDAEGNILQVDGGSTAQYVYDALNRRVRVQTASSTYEYLFDYAGRRISSWLEPNNFGNEGRIYWGNQQIAYRAWNGTTFFDHQDWQGTERMRTDYTGAIVSTYGSLPWGDGYTPNENDPIGNAQDNLHYAQLDHDSESDTQHAQFRQYSSTQGRWMSPDPYDGSYDGGNPQSFNRYSYVLNNPIGKIDPTGLLDESDPGDDPCDDVTCFIGSGGAGGGGDSFTVQQVVNVYADPLPDINAMATWITSGIQYFGAASNNLAPSKNCPASGGGIANVSVTTATPTTAGGAFIGSLFGPEGTAIGAAIGSSFGIGLSVSYVPSTNSWYAGWTAVASPLNGGGVSASYSFVPNGQNPNSIANGTSYSASSTTPFGPILTKSPGSGPSVPGIAVGTHTPIAVSAGHSWCVHNCGC